MAVRAEELGFDDIWTSEHHLVDDGYLSSSLVTCAAIAVRTKRVRVGTNVLLLPLHDPIRVAEDAATVDLLSGGRLDLGVAVGYRTTEYTTFGVDRASRGIRMDETVQVIRGLLSNPQFEFDGRFYRVPTAALSPRPIQRPFPVLIGALSKVAARRRPDHHRHRRLHLHGPTRGARRRRRHRVIAYDARGSGMTLASARGS